MYTPFKLFNDEVIIIFGIILLDKDSNVEVQSTEFTT